VVELQQTEKFSTKQLAQVLGISLPAAKSRLLRARMALRASLQAKKDTRKSESVADRVRVAIHAPGYPAVFEALSITSKVDDSARL
jgi:hypothetical protein